MDLKKRKHFTSKKEDNFLMNCSFLCLSFQTRKDLTLVNFYNAAVRRFLKLLENLQGNVCDVGPFQ